MTEEQQQRFMLTGLAIIGALFLWIMTKNILQHLPSPTAPVDIR